MKALWLSPDDAELLDCALQAWGLKLADEQPSLAHKIAGRYVVKRINIMRLRLSKITDAPIDAGRGQS